MSLQPQEYLVEALYDAPAEFTADDTTGFVVEVLTGTTLVLGEPVQQPEIIEVYSAPPTGGGYDRVEVLAFTKQGPLAVVATGASEFPIAGGTFLIESFAARVVDPPLGSAVVMDILKNDVSIFTIPANKPSIAAGARTAVVTMPTNVMLANGDYIEVHIDSVGSTSPGATLTASLRLSRIG